MRTELICNERRLRTQDHLVLLLTPQQVCEELFHNEWLFLRILEVLALLCVLDILEVLVALFIDPAVEQRASSDILGDAEDSEDVFSC